MSKKDTGIIKLEDGTYAYRFAINIDGKSITKKKIYDENGKKLYTKAQAIKAREAAIIKAHLEEKAKHKIIKRTMAEVYDEYRANGCNDKAYGTLKKQDCLWNVHIKNKFGKRYIDEIPVAEINDYLADLYYNHGLSYAYTEGFLKLFYLIFGQAYSRDYLDLYAYDKLCKNPSSKIHMPKMSVDDDSGEIVTFTREQIKILDNYFATTNSKTAYYLGRYCGLRINEAYGLKWDHINFDEGYILIDRQMQYQDQIIKLVPVKTKNGIRKIYMCDTLKQYLLELYEDRKRSAESLAKVIEQKQTIIEDLNKQKISSIELVNCLENGTLQTVNSMKYHTRTIKQKYNIDFKFHYLRHTYGTMLAEMNTPEHILCSQMGHGSIKVTHLYYLAVTKTGADILLQNLNNL